jgi:hypothetical protein
MKGQNVLGRRILRVARAIGVAGLVAGVACTRGSEGVRFPGDTTGIVRPRALRDLASAVRQLNAIVEAEVHDISTDYDQCEGPRTVLHLSGVRSRLGMSHTDTMSLRVFGGAMPGGRAVEMSESPRYVLGQRYLLFLFNSDWRFSPVIGDLAYRVQSVEGARVLISPGGLGVTGVSPSWVETHTRMLYLPEGVPGSAIRVSPTPVVSFQPCTVAPGGAARCPRFPTDTAPQREFIPTPAPFTPSPPNREEIPTLLSPDQLVFKIDSVARTLRVTPGGYFARRPRLECWNVVPTRKPQ